MRALVLRSSQREFFCKIEETNEQVKARAIGNILKDGDVVVGDLVNVREADNNEFEIIEIYPRKNEIYRLLVREKRKKIIASNCDLMVIVVSVSKPAYKRGVVDRFLVRAHQWSVTPLVIFTKMDEFNDEIDLCFEANRLNGVARSFEISAVDKNYSKKFLEAGVVELKEILASKRAIVVGQSGVGKSKLITLLSGGEVSLKSGDLGKRSGKGAHTTTWAEIVHCGDFFLIDSPGIRSFALDDIFEEDLIGHFPDLAKIATECKFSNCNHDEESKGCAFGNQSKETLSRLESYLKMEDEVKSRKQWDKD